MARIADECTQEELNSLYEGHVFNIAIRYPISLNTLFVALTYWYVPCALWREQPGQRRERG